MKKVWKLSITTKSNYVIDLSINHLETDDDSVEQENHSTPGGAFDSIVHTIIRVEEVDTVYKIVSKMYKKNFTFSPEAKRIYRPYFHKAKHNRPDFFI